MALRHPVPEFEWSQFGDGGTSRVPFLKAPTRVEFVRGAGSREFVAAVAANSSLVVDAAFGAGKSVDMPMMLVDAGYQLVIHVVPSRNLAGSLARYVANKYKGKPVAFSDIGGEVPESGLVLMSGAQYVWALTKWRAQGLVRKHVCYMDESHESDWVTIVMRRLRSSLPGCEKFLMASATHGADSFRNPVLPATLVNHRYAWEEPAMWDLEALDKPWSIHELDSDVLIYVDNEEDAQAVCAKYRDEGFNCFRCTAKTTDREFAAAMNVMDRAITGTATVMVVDYSYRFGYTFPTVGRIIDTARVMTLEMTMSGEGSVYRERNAYLAELAQTAARGARVAGRDCVYYRPMYEAQPVQVLGEGPEIDAAVLLYRMLGFIPPKEYENAVYYSGGLPAHAPRVLRGDSPLRMYARERVAWPGAPEVPKVEGLRPRAYSNSSAGSDVQVVGETGQSEGGGVTGSTTAVTSPASSIAEPVVGTRLGARPEGGSPPVPAPLPSSGRLPYDGSEFDKSMDMLREGFPTVVDVVVGDYYYIPGVELRASHRYPRGLESVLQVWGVDPTGWTALSGADPAVVSDVKNVCVAALNDASVVVNAAGYVVAKARDVVYTRAVSAQTVDLWAQMIRGQHDKAKALGTQAAAILQMFCGPELRKCEPRHAAEEAAARKMMALLQGQVAAYHHDPGEAEHYRRMAVDRGVTFGAYTNPLVYVPPTSGRYRMEINQDSVRHRVARKLLGGDPTVTVYAPSTRVDVARPQSQAERLAARFERRA